MKKYLQIFLRFLKLAWMTNMEYRANMLTWMAVDLGWTIMDLIFLSALLSNIQAVGSWSYPEMLILLGFSRLMVIPVWSWMFNSFSQIPQMIFKGNLDLILFKPIDSQFMVSIRHFSFSGISSFVGGLVFMFIGFSKLGHFPSVYQVVGLVVLTLISTVLIYGMYFSSVALSLFVSRLNNIHHVFTNAFDVAKYPPDIFPPFLQRLLTTVLPISIILVVPTGIVVSKTSLPQIAWLIILAGIFVCLSRWIWSTGLRRYSSASS